MGRAPRGIDLVCLGIEESEKKRPKELRAKGSERSHKRKGWDNQGQAGIRGGTIAIQSPHHLDTV